MGNTACAFRRAEKGHWNHSQHQFHFFLLLLPRIPTLQPPTQPHVLSFTKGRLKESKRRAGMGGGRLPVDYVQPRACTTPEKRHCKKAVFPKFEETCKVQPPMSEWAPGEPRAPAPGLGPQAPAPGSDPHIVAFPWHSMSPWHIISY